MFFTPLYSSLYYRYEYCFFLINSTRYTGTRTSSTRVVTVPYHPYAPVQVVGATPCVVVVLVLLLSALFCPILLLLIITTIKITARLGNNRITTTIRITDLQRQFHFANTPNYKIITEQPQVRFGTTQQQRIRFCTTQQQQLRFVPTYIVIYPYLLNCRLHLSNNTISVRGHLKQQLLDFLKQQIPDH